MTIYAFQAFFLSFLGFLLSTQGWLSFSRESARARKEWKVGRGIKKCRVPIGWLVKMRWRRVAEPSPATRDCPPNSATEATRTIETRYFSESVDNNDVGIKLLYQ